MSKTALILLDLQVGILERLPDEADGYVQRIAEAIKAARAAEISIIYVKTAFRPGHPELSSRNFTVAKIASYGGYTEGDASVEISADVAPLKGDIVVTKRRASAFSGSDLDVVLRGLNVDSLVLVGLATSGAVLSTVRQAADLDFDLTVIGDLCWDPDPEVHRVLVEKVFPRQVHTLSAEQWIQAVAGKKD
jgi:nicotinamidase-related amidase